MYLSYSGWVALSMHDSHKIAIKDMARRIAKATPIGLQEIYQEIIINSGEQSTFLDVLLKPNPMTKAVTLHIVAMYGGPKAISWLHPRTPGWLRMTTA